MADLLPPNATAQEKALSEAIARLSDVSVPIAELWNPWTCPVLLLPWLAWALSVDEWDSAWSEKQKRATIAAAVQVHRIKGTRGALQRALDALGYTVRIREWFEESPTADPFTFSLEIDVDDRGIDGALYSMLRNTANGAKNTRSHLSGLTAVSTVRGQCLCGSGAFGGASIQVSPWTPSDIETGRPVLNVGSAFVLHQLVTVNPLGE